MWLFWRLFIWMHVQILLLLLKFDVKCVFYPKFSLERIKWCDISISIYVYIILYWGATPFVWYFTMSFIYLWQFKMLSISYMNINFLNLGVISFNFKLMTRKKRLTGFFTWVIVWENKRIHSIFYKENIVP